MYTREQLLAMADEDRLQRIERALKLAEELEPFEDDSTSAPDWDESPEMVPEPLCVPETQEELQSALEGMHQLALAWEKFATKCHDAADSHALPDDHNNEIAELNAAAKEARLALEGF